MENFNWTPVWIMLAIWFPIMVYIVFKANRKEQRREDQEKMLGLSGVDRNIEEVRQAQRRRVRALRYKG